MDYWLPVTGVFPALMVLLLFTCFYVLGIDSFAAVVVTLIAQYLCFNLFHLDGLMDTADAFLGTADREKRLSILKDSRVGVYGFFAGFAALSLKAAFLRIVFAMPPQYPGLSPGNFPPAALFLAFPLFGRFSAALVPCMAKPVSPGGLGAVTRDARPGRCIAGIVTALVCFGLCVFVWALLLNALSLHSAVAGRLPLFETASQPYLPAVLRALVYTGFCLALTGPLTAWFYARAYRDSLGGYTGDALGATIESAEILSLAAAAVVMRLCPL
jgi:adenosylcobinamide-GDP ribazoletransferase